MTVRVTLYKLYGILVYDQDVIVNRAHGNCYNYYERNRTLKCICRGRRMQHSYYLIDNIKHLIDFI